MDLVDSILKDIQDSTVLFERKLCSATIVQFRMEQSALSLRLLDANTSDVVAQMAADLAEHVDEPWLDVMSHVDEIRDRVSKLRRGEQAVTPPKLSLVAPIVPDETAPETAGLPLRSMAKPKAVLDERAPWPVTAVEPEEPPSQTLPDDPSDVPPSPALEGRRRL